MKKHHVSIPMPTMKHALPALALSLGLMVFPAAQAALVSMTFEVKPDSGPLAGTTSFGSFSYDDASGLPSAVVPGETVYALTSFSFSFAGNTFGLGDLAYGDAVFGGTSFLGLDAAGSVFSLLPSVSGMDAFFAYAIAGLGSGNGDVAFAEVPPGPGGVPAPAPLWLLLAGLAPLAAAARRRSRAA